MKKFVPREKMSKKERKKLDSEKRSEWTFLPVTRRVESKKVYNRKRISRVHDERGTGVFFRALQGGSGGSRAGDRGCTGNKAA